MAATVSVNSHKFYAAKNFNKKLKLKLSQNLLICRLRFYVKNNQHQILFKISYKTRVFKDINLYVTWDCFWSKMTSSSLQIFWRSF